MNHNQLLNNSHQFSNGAFRKSRQRLRGLKFLVQKVLLQSLTSIIFNIKSMALPLLVLLSLFASPATADPLNHICSNTGNISGNNGTYRSNLNLLLSTLSSNASATGFATSATGKLPDTVYGLTFCRGDLDIATCRSCLTTATPDIQQLCPNYTTAAIWYDHCQLRFSNLNFLGPPDVANNIQFLLQNSMAVSADQLLRFQILASALMGNLSDLAVRNTSLLVATGEAALTAADVIYGMVQCERDLSAADCRTCLQGSLKQMVNDLPEGRRGERIMGFWCYMRYEFGKFYPGTSMLQLSSDQSQSPQSTTNASHPPADLSHGGNAGSNTVGTTIKIILSVLVVFALITTACICFLRRRSKKKKSGDGNTDEITDVESFFFDLSTLKVATSNFSEHNKLGEGGFGSVYMGLLSDGREVAVKRLSKGSKQGLNELKNELILVAKLQHKNLVKLYGICLEEQEKLLVYEYAPNKSLDTILFDPIKSNLLDWVMRYKIIEGIARGLLYLHDDSQLKIIHRDLKASNVLLDANMNPKISDFGIAKLYEGEGTHEMTSRVVGTFGYMAPEYGLHGHFSSKSDVFSFGVLTLEIITGRRNSLSFNVELVEDLLSYVWVKWKKGEVLEIVDLALGKLFENNEVVRCIQIGLLCVQEDPAQRPTIAEVRMMLDGYSMSLKAPSMPAFFMGGNSINSSTLSKNIGMREDGTYNSSRKFVLMSPNEVSISELDPR